MTTSLIALIANALPEDLAVVTACSYLFRSSGSVIGVSLASTILQQSLREQLAQRLDFGADAEDTARKVRESLAYINTLSPNLQEIVRDCYGRAARNCFIFTIFLAAGAAVGSCELTFTSFENSTNHVKRVHQGEELESVNRSE